MKINKKEKETSEGLILKIVEGIDTLKIIKQAKIKRKHNGR